MMKDKIQEWFENKCNSNVKVISWVGPIEELTMPSLRNYATLPIVNFLRLNLRALLVRNDWFPDYQIDEAGKCVYVVMRFDFDQGIACDMEMAKKLSDSALQAEKTQERLSSLRSYV